jgi:hypothetical protein
VEPGAIVREEVARTSVPYPPHAASVRCACDANGDLHVRAPQGATVTRPPDAANGDAVADISFEEEPRRPIRTVKSLGFIGDNKLTETPPRGGPWAAGDALLPPHAHDTWSSPYWAPPSSPRRRWR